MKVAIVGDPHLRERNFPCRKDDYLNATLEKLKYILDKNDKVILLGDVFEDAVNSTYLLNRVYRLFSAYPNSVYTILGNHDVFHRSLTDLDKTTINTLALVGAIDIKMEPFEIDGTKFAVSFVDKDKNNIPIDNDNECILLGHNYYSNTKDCREPNETLTKDELEKLNYRIVFLGHEHSPSEETFVANSILVRMGSLTRHTTDSYNLDRDIYYYQYDTVTTNYKRLRVPAKPTVEVYTEVAMEKKIKKREITFAEMGAIIDQISVQSGGNMSLEETLIEISTPRKFIDRIKVKHQDLGLPFT
jgi:DNA repair exonuclease SbcCD nuclease subunit